MIRCHESNQYPAFFIPGANDMLRPNFHGRTMRLQHQFTSTLVTSLGSLALGGGIWGED